MTEKEAQMLRRLEETKPEQITEEFLTSLDDEEFGLFLDFYFGEALPESIDEIVEQETARRIRQTVETGIEFDKARARFSGERELPWDSFEEWKAQHEKSIEKEIEPIIQERMARECRELFAHLTDDKFFALRNNLRELGASEEQMALVDVELRRRQRERMRLV